MKKTVLVALLVCATSVCAWKKEAHFISMPVIEGLGLYTSIRCLQDTRSTSTQIPSITTIALLAGDAGLGIFTVFGPQENAQTLRTIHRYIGFGVTAAALWMTIAAANDRDVNNLTRNVSYGYTAVTTVPIIIFSF